MQIDQAQGQEAKTLAAYRLSVLRATEDVENAFSALINRETQAAILTGGMSKGSPSRLAIAVAGDDVTLKQIVMTLVNDTGFDPVDAGSLEASWRRQPSTPAYCCNYGVEKMKKGLAANPTHDDIVAMNRSLYPLI